MGLSSVLAVTDSAAQSSSGQYQQQLQNVQKKLQEAQLAIQEQRDQQALAASEEALHDSEQLPETVPLVIESRAVAQTLMGITYAKMKDHLRAVEVWRKAISLFFLILPSRSGLF